MKLQLDNKLTMMVVILELSNRLVLLDQRRTERFRLFLYFK